MSEITITLTDRQSFILARLLQDKSHQLVKDIGELQTDPDAVYPRSVAYYYNEEVHELLDSMLAANPGLDRRLL